MQNNLKLTYLKKIFFKLWFKYLPKRTHDITVVTKMSIVRMVFYCVGFVF